jgi:hypothetical protein
MDQNDSNQPPDYQGFGPSPSDPAQSAPSGPGFARPPEMSIPVPVPNQFYGSPYLDPAMRKRCPLCAEEVSAAAHICHFCGYSFDDGTTAEQRAAAQSRLNAIEAARAAKGGRSGFYFRVVFPFLLLLMIFFFVGAILLTTLNNIGHILPSHSPTAPHLSPTPARTLGAAPSSADLFEIEWS